MDPLLAGEDNRQRNNQQQQQQQQQSPQQALMSRLQQVHQAGRDEVPHVDLVESGTFNLDVMQAMVDGDEAGT